MLVRVQPAPTSKMSVLPLFVAVFPITLPGHRTTIPLPPLLEAVFPLMVRFWPPTSIPPKVFKAAVFPLIVELAPPPPIPNPFRTAVFAVTVELSPIEIPTLLPFAMFPLMSELPRSRIPATLLL